jgi:pyruvate carboxylase
MFGDIVKVTPTSKVVGDLALMMVSSNLTPAQVEDPAYPVAFPQSVVELFHGDLGHPPGGFPPGLQAKVLKGQPPLTERPGATLPALDLEAARAEAAALVGHELSNRELASYLMYPNVYVDFAKHQNTYGNVDNLGTATFFYGMEVGREIAIEIERGKTLIVRYLALGSPDENGYRRVYFELNGQPRTISVLDIHLTGLTPPPPKAEAGNPRHIGAPMPGLIVKVSASDGQVVRKGEPLLTIEAMKMQTIVQVPVDGTVRAVLTPVGARVGAGDLLVELE